MKIAFEAQAKAEKKIQVGFIELKAKKAHLRDLRKQLKDTYDQDKEYHEIDEQLKAKRKELKTRKDQMEVGSSAITTLKESIEKAKNNFNSVQLSLSDLLFDYKEKTGSDTVPDDNGEIVKIKIEKKVTTEKI